MVANEKYPCIIIFYMALVYPIMLYSLWSILNNLEVYSLFYYKGHRNHFI